MVCPQCGAEVVAKAIFCHKCGYQLAELDSQIDPVSSALPAKASSGGKKLKAAAAQLDTDENQELELWRGGYSPKAMIGAWSLSALVSIVLLIIGILWVRTAWLWVVLLLVVFGFWIYNLIMYAYRRLNVRYMLGNQCFIHESGILRRVTDRIEVLDMDDITFEQGVFERLVGVGKIRVMSSDRTHPELMMYGIDNVCEISKLFDDTRRAERRRRGLHIENI